MSARPSASVTILDPDIARQISDSIALTQRQHAARKEFVALHQDRIDNLVTVMRDLEMHGHNKGRAASMRVVLNHLGLLSGADV